MKELKADSRLWPTAITFGYCSSGGEVLVSEEALYLKDHNDRLHEIRVTAETRGTVTRPGYSDTQIGWSEETVWLTPKTRKRFSDPIVWTRLRVQDAKAWKYADTSDTLDGIDLLGDDLLVVRWEESGRVELVLVERFTNDILRGVYRREIGVK